MGESYAAGDWRADDLVGCSRSWRSPPSRPATACRDGRSPASTAAARGCRPAPACPAPSATSQYHYDLGNDLYELFLDPSWTYSCAFFERPEMTLQEAQEAKYRRICEKLGLGPDSHVLEIGCGWGGFALHAAGEFGAPG